MDLLLIRPNDQKAIYGQLTSVTACEPPFWTATIAAYVRSKGFSVNILDAEALNQSPNEIIDHIKSINPKLIGITVTGTNLSASTWKMHGAGILAKSIKEVVNTPVFMWGLHPSALPEQTIKEESIDFVIKGEGLESICQLLSSLNNYQIELSGIKGLYYKKDGIISGNNEIDLVSDLNTLPMTAWDMLPMERYVAHNWQRLGEVSNGGYAVIATSLGCPYKCTFCAVSSLFGKQIVRYKSAEKIIEEIDLLVEKYDVHFIKIIDECFVLNKRHVLEICDKLIERKYDLNIWAYARVDTIDSETLDKLALANIKWLALGIESANEIAMNSVSKGQFNVNKTREVVKMIKDKGINIIANYMLGLPEDNKESMQKTMDFARELNCEWINIYATMAYPGSQLYFDCIAKGIELPTSWSGYSQFSYDCIPLPTKFLHSKEVLEYRDFAFNNFFKDNDKYFELVRAKFGEEAVGEINTLLKKKLKRKLLEQ